MGAVSPRWAAVMLATGLVAWAGPAAAQDADVEGYCAWVRGSADANRALLLSPELFARGSVVQSATDDTDGLSLDPALRVTTGATYHFGGLHRASAARDEAEAMCARYRAEAQLRGYGDLNDNLGLVAALGEELLVLEQALEDAQSMLERVRAEVEAGTATDVHLHASALRVERLRERRRGAQLKLAELRDLPSAPPTAEFPALLRAWRDADLHAESARASARLSRAWDASISLGYDEILGVDRALPLVASAQLSLNLGAFWQPSANRRAARGLADWRDAGPNPARERIDKTINTLRGVRAVEASRLEDVDVLLADVRERKKTIEGIDSAAARRHREALWFTEMDLSADRAYLRARIAEIDEFLAASDAPGAPRLRMTLGAVSALRAGKFRVAEAKTRGVVDHSDGHRASIQFVYHGPSADTAALGSGKIVRQIGLKLLAQDGCNLLYVMWRLGPEPELYVASKRNAGKRRHEECGSGGYTRLKGVRAESIGTFDDGKGHTLSAGITGQTLTVHIDGAVVWEGPVPETVLSLRGPAGFRTDNGEFEFALETR